MSTRSAASIPITAPVPFNLHAITSSRAFKPSRLAPIESELNANTAETIEGRDLMSSSPTTNAFYMSASSARMAAASSLPRAYKSQASARRRSSGIGQRAGQASSSSPTSLSTVTLNAHRLTRARSGPSTTRDLSQGEPVNPYEPGASSFGGLNRDGEWEEWTDEEAWRLGVEAMRAKKDWDRRRAALAPSSSEMERWIESGEEDQDAEEPPLDVVWEDSVDPEELYRTLLSEEEAEASQEQPPSDVVFGDSDGDPAQMLADALSRPRIPSLASDHGSRAASEHSSFQDSEDMDEGMDLDAHSRSEHPSPEALQAFILDLRSQTCPQCRSGELQSSDAGLGCAQCNWHLSAQIADPLARSFVSHHDGDPLKHRPLLEANPYTGTSVLCSACDEIIAV